MFFPRSRAPRVREADLAELRLSLNAPVIATDALPPGPARAAIALVRQPGNGFSLAIGVRSLRTGETVVFAPEDAYPDAAAAAVGVDAALSFAEGMGFLFDDDELATGGPEARDRAFARWCELLGEPHEDTSPGLRFAPTERAVAPAPGHASTRAQAPEAGGTGPALEPGFDELVLEDAVPDEPGAGPGESDASRVTAASPAVGAHAADFESSLVADRQAAAASTVPAPVEASARPAAADSGDAPPRAPRPGAAAPARPALPLTKFRRSAEPPREAAAPTPDGRAAEASADAANAAPPAGRKRAVLITKHGPALGRLQLVKRRRDPDAPPPPSWLQRLLGSF